MSNDVNKETAPAGIVDNILDADLGVILGEIAPVTAAAGLASVNAAEQGPPLSAQSKEREHTADDTLDNYMKSFEELESGLNELNSHAARIRRPIAGLQYKVEELMAMVLLMQRQLERMYGLMVEMNNIFGK